MCQMLTKNETCCLVFAIKSPPIKCNNIISENTSLFKNWYYRMLNKESDISFNNFKSLLESTVNGTTE